MPRDRTLRRHSREVLDDSPDVTSMDDATKATMPEDVPQHEDGSVRTDGEITEHAARKMGGVTVESVAKNASMSRKIKDKALGRSVRWNSEDAYEVFDAIKNAFPGEWSSSMVLVTRTEPAPKFQYAPISMGTLRNLEGLSKHIDSLHGASPPATYRVSFRSASGTEQGAGQFYMRDTTAPSMVQVIQPPPQQQQPQQPLPPYGGPGGWQGQGGAPQGGGPQGYWPQQPQQQQPIVVISPPQQQAAPQAPQPQAAPQAPQPIYMPPPPPAPGGYDPQRALVEMMQAQNTATMAVLERIANQMSKPQPPPPPAGFIPLPSEDYPMPPGFVRIPGGMIPAPPMAAYQQPQPQPQGVGAVPAQPAPVQYAAPAHAAPVFQAPVPLDQQISGAVKQVAGFMRGFQEMQSTLSQFAPGGAQSTTPPLDDEEEEESQAPNPMIVQDVGGIAMAIDRATGKTNWAATAMGAIPKLVDAAKSGLTEYQKLMDRQAAQTSRVLQERTHLANAVAAATGRVQQQQPQALPAPVPLPAQAAPPPPRPPVQAAPPAPPPKRGVSVPNGPLWPQ
jgi:hypothetical protein